MKQISLPHTNKDYEFSTHNDLGVFLNDIANAIRVGSPRNWERIFHKVKTETYDLEKDYSFYDKKYVVIASEGAEYIFVFPRGIDHDRMYEAVQYTVGYEFTDMPVPVSAGFVQDNFCYGESETLELKSRPDMDTKLLKAQLC